MPDILKKGESISSNNKMLVMKLNVFLSRYFGYLLFVFLTSLFVLGFLFFIKPKYQTVSESINSISSTKEAEYEELEHKYVKIHGIWSDYQRIDKKDIEKIGKMLPLSGDTEDLFREIEILILKSGLTLKSIEVLSEESSAKLKKSNSVPVTPSGSILDNVGMIKINVSVSGFDYDQFKKLLIAFENNLRLLDVNKINVSLVERTASFEITTYFLKSEQ